MQYLAREGIHSDTRLLACTYVRHLSFFVVGDDPHIRQWHQRDHLRANAKILARAYEALTDHAINRSYYSGVTQVDLRQITRSFLSLQRGDGLSLLAFQYVQLLTLLIQLCAVQCESGDRVFRCRQLVLRAAVYRRIGP